MEITKTRLEGCVVLRPRVFNDDRGYFYESFNERRFLELTGKSVQFVQDNQSFSTYGTLRGLHFQKGEHAQAKLVRVLKGEVLDIAVDLRPKSDTFGKHFSVILNDQNLLQLFVPRGFAHGFVVLSPEAEVFYKCDNFYNKESEGSILFNDPELAIDWKLPLDVVNLSEKDKLSGSFEFFKTAI